MGLQPGKPNPVRASWASPLQGTRRCTKCLLRQPDEQFRWLQQGIRRASHCKTCERGHQSAPGDLRVAITTVILLGADD